MFWEIKERIHDEKKRKHVIVLSLVRLEWGWIKHAKSSLYYIKGLFAIQRIINDDGFCIFKGGEIKTMKKWRNPLMETITKDEIADLVTAAGCSDYFEICEYFY